MCIFSYKRLAAVIILLSIFISCHADAASVAPYNGRLNTAIGSILAETIAKNKNVILTDPRLIQTVSNVSTAVAAAAPGLLSTIVWPRLLQALRIAGYAKTVVDLATDKNIGWFWNTDNENVTLSGSDMSTPITSLTGLVNIPNLYPDMWTSCGVDADCWYRDTATGTIRWIRTRAIPCVGTCVGTTVPAPFNGNWTAEFNSVYTGVTTGINNFFRYNWSFNSGTYFKVIYEYIYRTGETHYMPKAYLPASKPPEAAIADVPDSALKSKLSDKMLADIVTTLWDYASKQNAAIPFPYDVTVVIPPSAITDWRLRNPGLVPGVPDLFTPPAPQSTPGVLPIPITPPPTVTPTPDPAAVTPATKIDLGEDPSISLPSLEEAPTAESILSPITSLMADFRSFAVPAHTSTCYKPSFELWENTFVIDAQCTLIEEQRGLIQVMFVLFWTLTGVLIVLRA